MRPCRRQTAIVDMSLRGAALSLCAVLMLSAASWPAPSLAQSVNQSGRGSGWPEDPRLRPYVIEGAPDERGVENEPRRRATARSVPREESAREERSDEAVPSPVPVARPALAGSAVRSVASATGGASCSNPNALGVSREVEIDAASGPRYGFQQYKLIDFLREGEIVLTFDDGPMPAYTKPILQALSHHCTKATFFIVGRNALAYPEVVKDEAARGHTIANHTFSHANLGMRRIVPKRTPLADGWSADLPAAQPSSAGIFTSSVPRAAYPASSHPTMTPGSIQQQPTFAPAMSADKAKAEIELGFSATSRALGVPMAPFFRFPYLGYSTAMHNYLSERNVAVFSIDVDSVDYRAKRAEDVITKVMSDLSHQKKGILLFHDIQPATAQAMPALLDLLQAKGYRVVHLRAKNQLQTIASYDARVGKDGIKMDAVAEKKPLVKRTMTWGMSGDMAAGSGGPAVAAQTAEGDPARRAKKPIVKVDRSEVPGYVPARTGQPEVLPWLTETRRNNGW